MKEYRIAVIGGDGIGPEVVREGLRALETLASIHGFRCRFEHYPYGAQHYLKTRELMSPSAVEEMRQMDAIFLGAIGDPRVEVGLLERAIVGGLRFDLDLYVNLRPIRLYAEHLCPIKNKRPQDINFIVVRENTEDVYTGMGGFFKKGTPDEIAIQEMICTRKGTERVIRYAYEKARDRGKARPRLTLVDKANAVRAHDLWTRTFEEVGREFPEVEKDHAYVDACAMWMIRSPEWFDVVVTTNMFGDILTDLGAMLQGGMGIAASGNIHPGHVSMFEPIHGSAPKYAGKNTANPLAAISAAQMMLEYLGEKESAAMLEKAIESVLVTRKVGSVGAESGLSTSGIGDVVLEKLKQGAAKTVGA